MCFVYQKHMITKVLLIHSPNLFSWASYPMFFNRTETPIYVCQHQGLMIGVGVREPLHQRLTSIGPQQGRKQKQKTEKHLFFLWQLFPLKAPKAFRVSRWQSSPFTLPLLNMYLDNNQGGNIYVQLYINWLFPHLKSLACLSSTKVLWGNSRNCPSCPAPCQPPHIPASPSPSRLCLSPPSLIPLEMPALSVSLWEPLGGGGWWVLQHQLQLDPPPLLPPSPSLPTLFFSSPLHQTSSQHPSPSTLLPPSPHHSHHHPQFLLKTVIVIVMYYFRRKPNSIHRVRQSTLTPCYKWFLLGLEEPEKSADAKIQKFCAVWLFLIFEGVANS